MGHRQLRLRRHLVRRRAISHALQRENVSGDVCAVELNTTPRNATVRVTARSVDGTPALTGYGLIVHGEKSRTATLKTMLCSSTPARKPKYEIIKQKAASKRPSCHGPGRQSFAPAPIPISWRYAPKAPNLRSISTASMWNGLRTPKTSRAAWPGFIPATRGSGVRRSRNQTIVQSPRSNVQCHHSRQLAWMFVHSRPPVARLTVLDFDVGPWTFRMQVNLRVLAGPYQGRVFCFTQPDTFLIGRSNEAHLCLTDDKFFSRHHCLLEITPPRCFLRDLGSTNGTFVNGQRVAEAFLRMARKSRAAKLCCWLK